MEVSNLKPFDNDKTKVSLKDKLKFIIPSLIGVLLFIIPIKHEGDVTIPIAIFSGKLVNFLGEYLVYIITITLIISAIFSFIATVFKPKFIINNKPVSYTHLDVYKRQIFTILWTCCSLRMELN